MTEMLHYFKKHNKYLVHPITVEQINNIVYYAERNWYLQILKEYGIVICLILIEYYAYAEKYLRCKKIITAIEHSNINFGTFYVKNLEEYLKLI